MALETAILLVQTLVTASIKGWLFLGVMDNYLTPSLSGGFARSVLTFERLKEMYPDVFTRVQYREIKSPALLKTIFAVIVVSETLVCLVLFVGVYMMSRALLGLEDPEAAWVVALLAVLGFTLIWSAFLVFGNWFLLWMCHEWVQSNHFQLLLWGIVTMLLLILGS